MESTRFGQRLRELRRRAHKTLAELAEAVGRSVAYISEIEIGRRRPMPITTEVYSAIRTCLRLSDQESDELIRLSVADRFQPDEHLVGAAANMEERLKLYRDVLAADPGTLARVRDILATTVATPDKPSTKEIPA